MDEQTQQQFTVAAAGRAGMESAELWIAYYALGGSLSQLELEAYLLGVQVMSPLERDILAHTLNEALQDTASELRVPYSTDGGTTTGSTNPESTNPGSTSPDSAGAQVAFNRINEVHHVLEQALAQALESLGAAGVSFLTAEEAEEQRLRAVERTGLVDSGPEERFDRITRQAREHFGVSSAIVALVTDRRQFLKSVTGPVDQNLPREVSFCNETIRSAGALIVNDTLADERFRTNPLVTGEPHLRFYAGYPLMGSGGWVVGTLCVLDQNPRAFSAEDERQLRALARTAEHEINS